MCPAEHDADAAQGVLPRGECESGVRSDIQSRSDDDTEDERLAERGGGAVTSPVAATVRRPRRSCCADLRERLSNSSCALQHNSSVHKHCYNLQRIFLPRRTRSLQRLLPRDHRRALGWTWSTFSGHGTLIDDVLFLCVAEVLYLFTDASNFKKSSRKGFSTVSPCLESGAVWCSSVPLAAQIL